MPQIAVYAPPRLLWVVALLLSMGCTPTPQIRTYTVQRQKSNQPHATPAMSEQDSTQAIPARLFGGIIFRGEQAWYFKITGPSEELDAKLEQVRSFLKSIRFAENAEQPEWTLPEDWKLDPKQRPARFATIRIPLSKGDAELSVIMLPIPQQQDETSYLLANVNRWRDQLSQTPVSAEELKDLEIIPANGLEVRFVSILGKQKASTGMNAPFAS